MGDRFVVSLSISGLDVTENSIGNAQSRGARDAEKNQTIFPSRHSILTTSPPLDTAVFPCFRERGEKRCFPAVVLQKHFGDSRNQPEISVYLERWVVVEHIREH